MKFKTLAQRNTERMNSPLSFKGEALPISNAPNYVRAVPMTAPKSYIPWTENKEFKAQETELDKKVSELSRYSKYFERAEELSKRSPILRQAQMKALNAQYGISDEESFNKFVGDYATLVSDTEKLTNKYNLAAENEAIRYKLWQESLRPYADVQNDIDAVDKEISDLELQRKRNVTDDSPFKSPLLKQSVPTTEEGKKADAEIASKIEEAKKRREALQLEKKDSENYYYTNLTKKTDFSEKSKWDGKIDSFTVKRSQTTSDQGRSPEFYATDEEAAIYRYLKNTKGEEAAEEYSDYMRDTWNQRKAGKLVATTESMPAVFEQLAKATQSLDAGVERYGQGVYSAITGKTVSPTAKQYAKQTYREKSNTIGKAVYDLSESIGNMAPGILLSAVTGNPTAGLVSIGVSSGGNAYNEARKNGASKADAYAYGTLVGMSEAILGKALGGITKLGGGKIGTAVASKLNAIDKAYLAVAGKLAANGISEGVEEGLQTILEPIFATMVLDEKYKPAELLDVGYSALLGFLSAGFLEGGNTTAEYFNSPLDQKVIDKYISDGEKAAENSLERAIADDIKSKLSANPDAPITGFDVGRIARYYKDTRKAEKKANKELKKTLIKTAENETTSSAPVEVPATPQPEEQLAEFEEAAPIDDDTPEPVTNKPAPPLELTAKTTPTVSRDGIEIKPETDPEVQSRLFWAKNELERTGILSGASDKTIKTVRRLSKLLKTDIRFEVVSPIAGNDGDTYDQNGRYDRDDGIIYINMGSGTDTYTQIIAHEFTHSVEGTKLYTLLEKYARKFHNAKAGEGAFNAKAREILEQYRAAGKDYDIGRAQAEVVSNYVADELLNNKANIERLVKENRSLAEKLKDIVDIVLSAIGTKVTRKEAQTRVKLTRMSKLLGDALKARDSRTNKTSDIKSRYKELRRKILNEEISEEDYEAELDELDNEALSMGLDLQELMKDGESGISYSLTREELLSLNIDWDENSKSSLKEQLKNHLEEVNAMEPVTEIVYDQNTKKSYYTIFKDLLNKWGNKIDTQYYGSIIFDSGSVSDLGNYIKTDAEKAAALAAPYVVKRGKVISGHKNHKNSGSTSLTFAAPVIINGDKGNVVVSVIYGKGRVHSLRVLTPEGKEFVLTKKENAELRTMNNGFSAGRRENTTKAPHISSASIDSIPQPSKKVNSKIDTDSYSITPEKATEESIDKSTSDVPVVTRLPIQSLGKLRAVEKGLRKAIGDIYKIKYARVDELKPAIRKLTEKYLSDGKITAEDIAEFTDFIKTTFEIESTKEDTNRVRYQLNEAINEDLVHIRDFFKQLEKEANAQPEWVQESREESAKRFSNKKIREFRNWVRDEFSVPESEKGTLDALIANIITRIENGTVPKDIIDASFGAVFNSAEYTEESLKRDFPDVYRALRYDKLTLTDSEKSDLAGYGSYKEFREDAQGYLNLGKDGTSVEDMYAFCHSVAPSLFPDSIDNTNDQAVRLLEVSKMFTPQKRWAFEEMSQKEREKLYDDFTKQVLGLARDVTTAQRYAQGTSTVEQEAEVDGNDVDVNELLDVMEKMKKERRKMLSVRGRTILSEKDEGALRAILDGHVTLDQLSDEYNKKDIEAIYEASKEYTRLKNIVDEQCRQIRERRYDMAKKYLADGDILTGFRDRNHGLLYMLNPMERNLRYVGKRSQLSEDMIDAFIKPIKRANRNAILYKNSIVQKIEALELSRKVKAGDEYSEAYAVQFVGEAENNIKYLKKLKDNRATKDGHTLEEWQTMLDEFWKVNPGIDRNKINGAVDVFREVYNDLFKKMNEARVRNGYEPISYRSGYFPHFSPKESNDILAQFGKALGITVEFSGLPTDINGLTQNFRPGMRYQAFANERLGFETVFDAVEGLHRYLDTAADVIYQTDNICNLRALAQQIRYQASDEGKRKREDFIRLRTDLDETERAAVLDRIHEGGKYTLSNFVNDLEEYTNLLAGKKSKWDRGAEALFGRSLYGLMKNVSGRIAANMVAWNVGSWLTNFIPLVQGATGLDTKYMLVGMKEAMSNLYEADGFESQSVWLTTRRGSEELLKRYELTNIPTSKLGKALDKEALHKIGRALDKSAEIGMIPMEAIDMFVSNTLVRGRYHQNMDKGMDSESALEEADSWVAGIMADRSKGGLPTIFGATNPIVKLLTQFQVEVANQIGFFFSDLPMQLRDKEAKAIVLAIAKYIIGAYLYNELYEFLTGRRPALDPLGIINDSIGDFTGKKLRDPVDAIVSLAKGENFLAEAYKMPVGEAMWEFTMELAEETPFVGGLLGGGRIPISSALPSLPNIVQSVGKDGALRKIGKELLKPVTYSILPGGGGQISKTAKGISAVAQGGKYGKDNKGREILQYPITPNPWTAFQSAVFGPTATKGGREWINSNFKSSLSYVETKAYKEAVYEGMTQDEAYDLIESVSSAGNKNSQKIAALNSAKVPQNVKRTVYEQMFLPESPNRVATLNALDKVGSYRDVIIDFMLEHPDVSSQEELMTIWGDKIKAGRIVGSGSSFTKQEKAAILQTVLPNTKNNPYWPELKESVYYVVHPDIKLEDEEKKRKNK